MPIPGLTVEDVDAYSDVSNGSTISVGSAASGGSGHMPRPPTAGSRRSRSVQGRRSRVAKSPYSSSTLKGSSKHQPPKPAARNMWITAMRNGTSTLSTENSSMNTWSGTRPSHSSKQMKTGSRARHMSDYVSIKDIKNKSHVRSASMSASEPQLTGGGPAYKPQEDYYDEIIELKKIINALKEENNVINTKLRRVEGDNVLKERKLEDLLNQRKQPEDMRRTLTDKKGDTSAIVNSLKQKLHAVERTVKDKETELSKLKKDMKMTNIEELQIQSETYYQEVQRLQLALLEMQQAQVHDPPGGWSSPRSSPSSRRSKEKPSTLTLQRLSEENDHLKAENRSLKKDLLAAIENSSTGEKKVALKTEYADMNRGQLLAKIHELEEKLQDSGGKKILPRKGSLPEEKQTDLEVRRKSISKSAEVPGRIELKGTTSQKLAQLQEREIELLEEREKQRKVIEQLKEDRAHYRSVADDLRLQLKSTQDELVILKGEKAAVGERRRSSASLSSPRKLSLKDTSSPDNNDDDLDRMLKEFQQQRAAKTLQRQWRGYQGKKQQQAIQEEEQKRNGAAVTLQKNWRRHRDRTKQQEEEAKEEAIKEIQAALRGQAVRSKYIEEINKDFTDRDDAIVTIQSAMRAHSARMKHLGEEPGHELEARETRTRGSSSHLSLGSEPDSDDGLVTSSSSSRRHPGPALTNARRHSLSEKTRAYRGKKHAAEEATKSETGDSNEKNSKTEGSRRVISAPRFSNISEHSEDEDSRLNENRYGRTRNESAHDVTEQQRKKKGFEIVDSDDDDDDAVVTGPRRSLDTGLNRQRPSLSRSNRDITLSGPSKENGPGLSRSSRGINPPLTSEDNFKTVESRPGLSRSSRGISPPPTNEDSVKTAESRPGLTRSSRGISRPASSDDRTRTFESRPGLSRASGHLSVNRDFEDSEKEQEENASRPGLSSSKRPLSGKKTSLTRSGSRDKDKDSPRASASGRSRMITGSEEDSGEDDVIMTGKKTKNVSGDGKKGGRPSLTRRSSPSASSSQRDSLVNSLDNFFSSTSSNKGSSSKKSPRKTQAKVRESEDDDDDDDDDDIVVSSLSKLKSRKGQQTRKDSRDSVADLWATSGKGGDSSKRKSSIKSSKRETWSTDFEFEKPPRRPESQLDELF
ncbi:uncharacterized protein [Porites lutea]|uniref:uncharacterized protein isoform X2 n=1 Tax=Porites lutea TaxID=51062 RepID=UPI003CC65543